MTEDTNQIEESAAEDPIFSAEQAHLSKTYAKLLSMQDALIARMKNTADAAENYKRSIADEATSNFASEGEAQETYIEYANLNSVIDALNQSQQVDAEKLSNIELLKPQPYFAKVALQFKPGAEAKEIYIGNAGISDESYHRLIVDWRSPVAEVYYNQANGKTSYQANGRTISCDLKLRRQFDITEDTLNAYFDTTVAIQDELLLRSLSQQRTSQMSAITATIQKEQNEVIRHDDVPALLVNGIAGSGKTSVLLQRIAYLFYQKRESLNPEQVYLITPNPVFRTYIDNVLPDMGEKNPPILTWDEFASSVVPEGRVFDRFHTSLEVLQRIDDAIPNLKFTEKDFRDIKMQGVTLISANQINKIASQYKNVPAGPRLITLVREELEDRFESRLGQMSSVEKFQDEVSALSYNQQLALFGEPAIMDTEEQAKKYTLIYLNFRFGEARTSIQLNHWVRVDRIAKRLLGIEDLSFLEWFYLKIACTGLVNDEARFVMIDEVQDYSPAQLAVMARYYHRAHFLLLGDENQAIGDSTSTFSEVREVFMKYRGSIEECFLMTSYRSTPAITKLFAQLAQNNTGMQISSVQRDDKEPEIIVCSTEEEIKAELHRIIPEVHGESGLSAVVVNNEQELTEMWDILKTIVPADQLHFIAEGSTLPDHGVVLIDLQLAKGLEFDNVIIPDANQDVYPDTDLARRQLYTTISRATNTVSLLAKGKLTSLIKR